MHFLNKPACKAEEFKDEKIKELLFVGKQSAQNYHTRISNIITENLSFNGDCSFDSKNSVTSFNPFEYFSGTSPARPCTERSHQSHSAENLIDKQESDCNGNEIHNTLSNASTFVPKSGERLMEFEIDMRKDGKEIEVEFDNLEEKHKENLELDIIDDSFCDHSIVSRYSISTTTDRNTMEKLPLGLFKKKEKKEEMQSFESLGTLGFVSMPSLEECANDVKEDQVNNLLEVEDKIITVEEKKNRIGHRSNGALTREERKKDIMGKEVNEGKKDTIEEGGKEDLISKDGNEDVIGREENECVTVKNDTIHACVDVKNESKLHTENDIEEVNLTDINTPSLVQRKPDGKFLGQLMQASIEIDVGISKLVKKKNNSLNSMALVNGEFETPIQLKKSQSLSLCNSNTNDGSNMTKTLRRSSSGTPNPEKNINTFNDSDGLKEKTENDVHCNVASELINDQSPHNHNGSVSTDNDSEGIAETLLSQNTVGSTIQSNEQKGGLCDDIEIVRMMTHQSSLQLSGYGPNVVIDKSAKSSIQGLNDNNVGYTKFMSQLSNQMSYKESRGEIVSFLSIEGDQEVLRIFSMNSY
uniref:Uncharacterized protein n=1 Tax=Corethron hystrix TaxID=216773 RepID=A0A7S1BL53_9STRA|mmetsp:Transcript_30724/g.70302  ORF Transcript_30724/g.70302 Transcript_30724/m.70302 type:complete len:584 (+) Transcript_30724:190-1941(+)